MRLQQLPERTAAEADHAERVGRHQDGRPLARLPTHQGRRQDAQHRARRVTGPVRRAVVRAWRARDGPDLEVE
jgi:hypothetical protein